MNGDVNACPAMNYVLHRLTASLYDGKVTINGAGASRGCYICKGNLQITQGMGSKLPQYKAVVHIWKRRVRF